MKEETKSKIVGMSVSLLIMVIFGLAILSSYNKFGDMLDECHSAGYDGFKDVSGFMRMSKYKCYKEVSVGTGYEYEYSGYVKYGGK